MPDVMVQLAMLIVAAAIVGVAFNLIEYGGLAVLRHAQSIRFSRALPHALVYLATYAAVSAAIVAAVFSESLLARWIALPAVFILLTLELACRFVQGENVGFNEVQTTLSESTFAGQFLSSHFGAGMRAAGVAGLVTAGLFAAGFWETLRFDLWWLLLVLLGGVMAYVVIWRTVAATDVFPSPIRIPVLLIYVLMNRVENRPRDPVELAVPEEAAARPRVILFIMDESITGTYLGINGYEKSTTPFMRSIEGSYHNLGIACAGSNISAATNLIIRSGLRADQIPDRRQIGMKQPSVYQYAKAAGYRTCYLDGQYGPDVCGNFLTRHDLSVIDEGYWAIGDESEASQRYLRDRLLAQRALDLIAEGGPIFIWLSKYGAHFHYEQAYPDEARVFEPTMPPNRSISACSSEQIENSYANALRWSMDAFLELLLPKLDPSETAVVYTADHGQSIEGSHGASTHADRVDPPAIQANVPMLVWGDPIMQRFADGIDAARDRTSHFQIFPTLLSVMGCDENDVMRRYGSPLWGSPPDRRVFLSGDIFGRGIVHVNDFRITNRSSAAASAVSCDTIPGSDSGIEKSHH